MKTKLLLIMIVPFAFLSALSAQVTQAQADSIVMERMSNETQTHTIFSKDGVQTEMTITTANDEIFDLVYPCLVYYIRYEDETNGKYLIVSESNGNLLEIRTESNAVAGNLAEWNFLPPKEIPFIHYPTYGYEGTLCRWRRVDDFARLDIINSKEELEMHLWCPLDRTYPEIDFSKYTLLLARGFHFYPPIEFEVQLQQISTVKYLLSIRPISIRVVQDFWLETLKVPKIADDADVILIFDYD